MNKIIEQAFFERPVLEVAENLIGQTLVIDGKELQINEIEAYDGEQDRACHASKGRTERTKILYGPAGHFYVYLCYGIHWLLNIVTGTEGYPAAILLRGAGEMDGPGKLTKALGIDKRFNGKAATPATGLYFAFSEQRPHSGLIQKTPRIGVDYAGLEWSQKPYRFLLADAPGDLPVADRH